MKHLILIFLFSFAVYGEECPFCQKEVLQKQTVFQGKHASILLDYKPIVEGHVLIIPNRHVGRFEDLNEEEILEMGLLVKKVQAVFENVYAADDYFLLQKNGKNAWQTVPHVHIHAIPRSDRVGTCWFAIRFLVRPQLWAMDEKEMSIVQEKLSEAFRGR